MAKWLEVKNAANTSGPVDLLIYDQIGKDWFSDSGIALKEFADELTRIPAERDIRVCINSPGGNVWDGWGIYNLLQLRREKVTCRVDGMAASIASVIAMAGRKTVMPEASLMLIHNPYTVAEGDADEMRKTADDLDKHKQVLVSIYAKKTGLSEDKISAMMDATTTMTGAEAKALGFCDECEGSPVAWNSFDLSRFRCVPAAVTGGVVPPPTGNKQKGKQTMSEPTKTAPTAEAPPAPVAVIDPAEFAKLKGQLDAERKARIETQIKNIAATRDFDVAEWLPRAVADETVLASLAKLPERGAAPVRPIVEAGDTEPSEPKNHIEAGKQFVALTDPKAAARFYRNHKAKVLASVYDAPRNANTFTTLTHTVLAARAMEAFTYALTPLQAFSTNFSSEAAQKGDKIKVMTTAAASAAVPFTGSYVMQGSTATGNDISIDKRYYVSWSLSTEEIMTQPQLSLDQFAVQKGNALAKGMLQDIWSLLTEANYGNVAISNAYTAGADQWVGAATDFDTADLGYIWAACESDNWPDMPRSLVLSIPYYAELFQQSDLVGTDGVGSSTDNIVKTAVIRELMGFSIYKTNCIPTLSDNTVGFAAHPDGILIANRVLLPEAGVALRPNTQVLTDPGTGASIVLRDWFDADNDVSKRVLEVNYGYLKGNANGIKLLASS